jgi:glycosyltransferase involved in cell wall biosynthesis
MSTNDTPARPQRTAILLAKKPALDLPEQISRAEHPRVEYLELAQRIGAEVIDFHAVERSTIPLVRKITQHLGPWWGLAVLGFLRRREFDHIYATGEDVGIPLTMLLRMARWHERLTLVIHNAGTPKRRVIFRALGHRVYRHLICLGHAQQRILTDEIGLPTSKVYMLEHWCDHHFYQADQLVTGDYVLSLGMEQRDYPTLQAAAQQLDYRFHVLASGWSPQAGFTDACGIEARSNITVERGVSFHRLRELYANCRFLVIPLKQVDYVVGVNAIVEGMAMGKAIIASAAPGIADYIKDGVSGIVVPVGDADALCKAIVELWEDPQRATAMGEHNRRWIEETINTDRYVARVTNLLGLSGDRRVASYQHNELHTS